MTLSNFSWVIPGKLAGAALPGGSLAASEAAIASDLRELHAQGIRAVLSAQRVPDRFGELCRDTGLEWLFHPIDDFSTPDDPAAFAVTVDSAVERVERGVAVCVHCRAGVGRTGLVLACIVGRLFGISGTRAVRAVRKARPAIDTDAQLEFVNDFCERNAGRGPVQRADGLAQTESTLP